jgi:hypothetical protein
MSTSLIKSPSALCTTSKMKGKSSSIVAISHPPHCVLQWGSNEIGSTSTATSAPIILLTSGTYMYMYVYISIYV